MYLRKLQLSRLLNRAYEEGDEAAKAAAAAKAAEEARLAEEAKKTKTFTQEDLNAVLAKERREFEAKMEEWKNKAKLTEEQASSFKEQVNTLTKKTEGELSLLKDQLKKTEEESKKVIEQHKAESELWKNRYETTIVTSQLVAAAATNEALDPDHIVTAFGSRARVEQKLDSDKKPTGEFTVLVPLIVEGKEALLSPTDFMAKLRTQKGYLFKGGKPGIGGSNSGGATGSNWANMTQEQKIEAARKEGLKAMKK